MGCFSLVSSCLSWASRRSSRFSSRSSLRPSARPACLPHTPMRSSSAHPPPRVPLLVSSARFFSSAHRLAPASYRPAPRLIRQAGRGGTIGGRSSISGRRLLACLGAMDGAARSFLDRFSFPLIVSSNRRGPGSGSSPHHLIISSSHRRGGTFFFLFRPTPSCLLFSTCLLWLVPPSPAGGCEGCDMACGGGREVCLLAFSSPCRSLRCRSFARCYTICVNRAARSCLGCCGAFYGLFFPLSCRRWRF